MCEVWGVCNLTIMHKENSKKKWENKTEGRENN